MLLQFQLAEDSRNCTQEYENREQLTVERIAIVNPETIVFAGEFT